MDIRCSALCLIVLSFLCFPFHENKLGHVCNCQNALTLTLYAVCICMQSHRLFLWDWERVKFKFPLWLLYLIYTNTHTFILYTADSLSRTISLWVSGPPCCSSCVTWQYIPQKTQHPGGHWVCVYMWVKCSDSDSLCSMRYICTWECAVRLCTLSTIKQVAQPEPNPLLWGSTTTNPRFPPGVSDFHFCTVMAYVYACHVNPTYTLFELLFPALCFPFAPMGCLAWPLAQISTYSVPQSSQSFGRTIFHHTCSLFPPKFLHLLSLVLCVPHH